MDEKILIYTKHYHNSLVEVHVNEKNTIVTQVKCQHGDKCSKYDFTFDDKIDGNDLMHKNVIIDKSSLGLLKGSNVDFKEELIGSSFKISNPKTKSSCGCGISFSF